MTLPESLLGVVTEQSTAALSLLMALTLLRPGKFGGATKARPASFRTGAWLEIWRVAFQSLEPKLVCDGKYGQADAQIDGNFKYAGSELPIGATFCRCSS
jgi:hypothetical protein